MYLSPLWSLDSLSSSVLIPSLHVHFPLSPLLDSLDRCMATPSNVSSVSGFVRWLTTSATSNFQEIFDGAFEGLHQETGKDLCDLGHPPASTRESRWHLADVELGSSLPMQSVADLLRNTDSPGDGFHHHPAQRGFLPDQNRLIRKRPSGVSKPRPRYLC